MSKEVDLFKVEGTPVKVIPSEVVAKIVTAVKSLQPGQRLTFSAEQLAALDVDRDHLVRTVRATGLAFRVSRVRDGLVLLPRTD